MKNKQNLTFKLLGGIFLIAAVVGIILLITGIGDFDKPNFFIGMFLLPIGLFLGSIFAIIGFKPEITRHSLKVAKRLQEENKDLLKDLATTTAEIHSNSIKLTAKSFNEALNESICCKHCGKQIDANSKFCNFCGKEQ